MGSNVQLKLIGKPVLIVGSTSTEIKPRAVFELLAVIMASGAEGVSRKALAERLWGHLDKANSRMQLRIAVHKLRDELRTLEIFDLFELGEKTVRYTGELDIDYLKLLKEQPPLNLIEVEALLYPIADGSNSEHWLAERDAFGEFVAKRVEASRHQAKSLEALTDILVRATGCFPTTLSLYLQLAKVLRVQGREAEVVEMTIQFEDRWVDRFGHADIPNIMELTKGQDIEDVPPAIAFDPGPTEIAVVSQAVLPSRPTELAPRLAIALVPVLVLSLVWSMWSNSVNRSRVSLPAIVPPAPRMIASNKVDVGGVNYKITRIRAAGNSLAGYTLCANGKMNLEEVLAGQEDAVEMQPNGAATRIASPDGWRTLCRFASYSASSDRSFEVKTTSIRHKVNGTAALPRAVFLRVLPHGSVLFLRQNAPPSQDAVAEYLLDATGEHLLVPGVGEKGVVIVTLVTADSVYLKYSRGPQDGWRFKTARYDLGHRTLNGLACAPVVARLTNGTLMTRPEVVIADGPGYLTSPTGKVVLVDGTGHQWNYSVGGRSSFDSVYSVGNILALVIHQGRLNSGLLFADAAGHVVNLPVPTEATEVKPDSVSGTVLLNCPAGARLSSDYFLIQPLKL